VIGFDLSFERMVGFGPAFERVALSSPSDASASQMQKRQISEQALLVDLIGGVNTFTHSLNKVEVLVKMRDDAGGGEVVGKIANQVLNQFDVIVAVDRPNVRIFIE
jgi:hypothetical protein